MVGCRLAVSLAVRPLIHIVMGGRVSACGVACRPSSHTYSNGWSGVGLRCRLPSPLLLPKRQTKKGLAVASPFCVVSVRVCLYSSAVNAFNSAFISSIPFGYFLKAFFCAFVLCSCIVVFVRFILSAICRSLNPSATSFITLFCMGV